MPKVMFELDEFRQRVKHASDRGHREDEPPVISQSTAVMALSLADAYERMAEGLRRLKNQDYDAGYSAEGYAEAILDGDEPTGEATIDG